MPKLNKWAVVYLPPNPYTAPEACPPRLYGIVEAHPRFRDGDDVTTTRIIGQKNGLIVTRSGSEYELGDPDPNYEKEFPNARERLFSSLEVLP